MKTILTLPPRAFAGLLKISAQKDTRYYLCGVLVEPDTGLLVATNGHALIAHQSYTRVPDVPPFIIPGELLANVAKAKCASVRVSIGDGEPGQRTVTLECGIGSGDEFVPAGATFTAPETAGRFPEWRHTVPTAPSGTPAQFDPALLARVHEAMSDVCETKRSRLGVLTHVSHNGPQNAALVTCSYVHTLAIIMPWRTGDDEPRNTLVALGLVDPHAPQPAVEPAAEALAA